jgi:hypothetical protein
MDFKYTTVEHSIVKDDPNYHTSSPCFTVQNQGSTVARVNQWILNPGDSVEVSQGGIIEKRLEIKFLSAYPFTQALANFPELWSGNRLLIIEMQLKGQALDSNIGAGTPGRIVVHRSGLGLLDAILNFSGGGLAAANTLIQDRQVVGPGTHNIDAGAYKVYVQNNGLIDITVNGDTVPPSEFWESEVQFNKTNNRQDFCPAVAINVPAGGSASYITTFPSI